ncbi:MAG: LPXTG cell wall anchor domain-containing protein [Lachnospiraceae bacterium]|nr:LPXTG cell wall anchor domain-containing protein [Lachnospiraceae bacterium]
MKLEQQEMEEAFQEEDSENAPEDGTGGAPDDDAGTVSEDSVSSDEAGSVSGDSVSGNSVSGDKIDVVSDNDADVHEHDETCYDAAGGLMCGYEDVAEPTITQTYKDENEKYIVTAAYKKEANIPEDAELKAEMITAESDGEHFAKREAEMKETLQDEDVKMDALFKIGFYADGKEVEPESDVMVTVQFLDNEGLEDGTPMTIVHFGENGNEVLGGSHVKDKSTTFKTSKFSDFAAIFRKVLTAVQVAPSLSKSDAADKGQEEAETSSGNGVESANSVSGDETNKGNYYGISRYQGKGTEQQTEAIEKEMTQPEALMISGNYDYKGNGYDVTFHVEGRATISGNQSSTASQPEATSDAEKETNGDSGSGDELDNGETMEGETPGEIGEISDSGNELGNDDGLKEENPEEIEGDSGSEEESSGEEETSGSEDASGDAAEDGENQDENIVIIDDESDEKLKFQVVNLGEDTEEHGTVTEYVQGRHNDDEQLMLDVLSYSMVYDGVQLDISKCNVSVTVNPKEETLKSYADEVLKNSDEDADTKITVDAMEITDDSEVKSLDSVVMTNDSDSKTVMNFTMSSRKMSVRAGGTNNPEFTVQYYANLDIVQQLPGSSTDEDYVTVINTLGEGKGTGGNLPQNGHGDSVSANHIKIENGKLKTEEKLLEVYAAKKYSYVEAPNLFYFNELYDNGNYKLAKIWILKEGRDKKSVDPNDWIQYDDPASVHFTNKDQTSSTVPNIVQINADTVIRLIYDVTTSNYNNPADFYDYDITDNGIETANETDNIKQRGLGINSIENYGAAAKTDGLPTLAFGNANSGTGLHLQKFNNNNLGNELNKYNANNNIVRVETSTGGSNKGGCTYKIAQKLDKNGKIIYDGNVHVQKLFNDGTAIGKTSYEYGSEYKYSLDFKREGDGYILSNVKNGDNAVNTASSLDGFIHPVCGSKTYKQIWTNNFWPMDHRKNTDPHTQTTPSIKYKGYDGGTAKSYGEREYPASDDGIPHNNMFGMHYTVDFELVEEYVGPLDYLFFGDDDMWVFLSRLDDEGENLVSDPTLDGYGKLVCDIGGVHSSVGEYVDLWDYIQKGSKGKYRLTFFYTERGLSGSTCYMQFTLPSVSTRIPEQNTGNIKVTKEAVKSSNGDVTAIAPGDPDAGKEYSFRVALSATDQNLYDDYAYKIYNSDGTFNRGEVVTVGTDFSNGKEFTLQAGQYIEVNYLPIGMQYEIKEINNAGDLDDYDTEINGEEQEERTIRGIIDQEGTTVVLSYKNILKLYNLPHTGGPGTMLYAGAGILLLLSGGWLVYRKRIVARRI